MRCSPSAKSTCACLALLYTTGAGGNANGGGNRPAPSPTAVADATGGAGGGATPPVLPPVRAPKSEEGWVKAGASVFRVIGACVVVVLLVESSGRGRDVVDDIGFVAVIGKGNKCAVAEGAVTVVVTG